MLYIIGLLRDKKEIKLNQTERTNLSTLLGFQKYITRPGAMITTRPRLWVNDPANLLCEEISNPLVETEAININPHGL